jgi:two-component system chemotaxis sensor kinase CheA
MEKYIKMKMGTEKRFCEFVQRFRKVPLNQLFARFPAMIERLANNLGKIIDPLTITGGDFLVLPEKYEPLVNSFVHLIRNMVDHGIEPPTDREIQQKPRAGSVKIDIQSTPEGIQIRFSDDGRGISLQTLKQKAQEKGIIPEDSEPDEEELLQLLFVQSLSTAEEVSNVSGWGVGLSAVKETVNHYKGKISVTTKLNAGTTFEIVLPAT